jgi:3-deoxy-7-phosphoheptulonate synthase
MQFDTRAHMIRVEEFRREIQDILTGRLNKKALIVGPCSIHNPEEALQYAKKLKAASMLVSDKILIIMRAFLEKPRTTNSWRGYITDPHLDGSLDLRYGIDKSKEFLNHLNQLEIPIAYEFIDPNLAFIVKDHISWGFIGARTVRSPTHRQLASDLEMPVGFKNPLDGDIEAVMQAIEIAATPHVALMSDSELKLAVKKTHGNPYCHAVLRGSKLGPNYNFASHMTSATIIDCAHGNSGKTLSGMRSAFDASCRILIQNPHIKGLMLESYLHEGSQKNNPSLKTGLSITDPCLSFEETQYFIEEYYKLLSQSQGSSSTLTGSSSISASSSETLMSSV